MSGFKFKKKAKADIGTEDAWYALTDGGYVTPADVLSDAKQSIEVQTAIDLVARFIQACYDKGVFEQQ